MSIKNSDDQKDSGWTKVGMYPDSITVLAIENTKLRKALELIRWNSSRAGRLNESETLDWIYAKTIETIGKRKLDPCFCTVTTKLPDKPCIQRPIKK